MAETLIEYSDLIQSEEGRQYRARACAKQVRGHSWHGWIEFEPVDGGAPVCSPRETTQPNRTGAEYWATGLTPVYLEGALWRALHPLTLRRPAEPAPPAFDGPAQEPAPAPSGGDSVLDPFSVYRKGEALLRSQLAAFSCWHLVNIVRAYGIPTGGRNPDRMTSHALIEAIVEAARRQAGSADDGLAGVSGVAADHRRHRPRAGRVGRERARESSRRIVD